jgi:hypothetical protein
LSEKVLEQITGSPPLCHDQGHPPHRSDSMTGLTLNVLNALNASLSPEKPAVRTRVRHLHPEADKSVKP